jgi:hypothetical protein
MIKLDWTPAQLTRTRERAFDSYIRVGRNFRRIVAEEYAHATTRAVAVCKPSIRIEPDAVLTADELRSEKARRTYATGTPSGWTPVYAYKRRSSWW